MLFQKVQVKLAMLQLSILVNVLQKLLCGNKKLKK